MLLWIVDGALYGIVMIFCIYYWEGMGPKPVILGLLFADLGGTIILGS
jgi:hypothetical protein